MLASPTTPPFALLVDAEAIESAPEMHLGARTDLHTGGFNVELRERLQPPATHEKRESPTLVCAWDANRGDRVCS